MLRYPPSSPARRRPERQLSRSVSPLKPPPAPAGYDAIKHRAAAIKQAASRRRDDDLVLEESSTASPDRPGLVPEHVTSFEVLLPL